MTSKLLLIVAFVATPLTLNASTKKFDKSMQPVLKAYLAIQKALAADTTATVARDAKKLAAAAKKVDVKKLKGEHAAHYAELPKKLVSAAGQLVAAKDVKAMREAFKALSKPMAMWATMSKLKQVNVVFCSMAKGSWLQAGKAIRNPYYGKKMLTCGEIISGPAKGKASGHMGHKHHH
ncbi:MAG: DUF3347 domain-containing protein [Deltaproteobacteria bacterium]|nr:DUF3347 domain-containing protein [Deltaproteobacteria bacterium]